MARLFAAVKEDNVEEVKRLVSQANVNLPGAHGLTPLCTSCGRGNLEITKVLLDAGADITAKDHHWLTPLHRAANSSCPEIVKLLIQRQADLNACDIDGSTPLHQAVCRGGAQTVKILLEAGADPTRCTYRYDRTPLHDAAMGEDAHVVDVFIEHGVDVDCRDAHGATPLMLAFEVGGNEEVTGALFDWGADPLAADDYEEDAYTSAQRYTNGVELFERHIIKLDAAKLLDDETRARRLPPPEKRSSEQKPFEKQCATEISSLRAKFVGHTNFTYYDLLSQKPAALVHPEIRACLSQKEHRTYFPIYGRVIDRQVKLGLQRLTLIKKGAEILKSCSNDLIRYLPPELIHLICTYLDNDTLQNVIDICLLEPTADPPCERSNHDKETSASLATSLNSLKMAVTDAYNFCSDVIKRK